MAGRDSEIVHYLRALNRKLVPLTFDDGNNMLVNLGADSVGLAREATLQSLLSRVDIQLSALNRLRVYEQSFETGTTDTTAYNCTQAVQSDVVFSGTRALRVTVPAGQTGYVETPVRPVSPGQRVTFTFAHREDENIVDVKLVVVWYRTNMRIIEVEVFTLTPSTSWQLDFRTVTAPQNAAYMALRMQATASDAADGNVYLDDMVMDYVGQILRVDGAGNLTVTIVNDDVGLAREATLSSILGQLDVALSTRASESTLASVDARLSALQRAMASVGADKILTTPDNPPNLDTPLSTIDSRLYSAADALSVYDHAKQIRAQVDAHLPNLDVALSTRASEATLSSILGQLDITLSSHRDSIVSALQAVQARYARLQIYSSASAAWVDVVDRLPVAIDADDVGLLKEGGSVNVANFPADYPDSGAHARLDAIHSDLYDSSTGNRAISVLQSIDSKLATEATLSAIRTNIDVALSTRASESTLATVASRLFDSSESKSITAILKEIRDKGQWARLDRLDVALSTRASESTLSTVAARLYDSAEAKSITDVLKEVRDRVATESTLSSIYSRLDVALSTRASESTLATVSSRLYDSGEGKSITDILKETRDRVATESTLSSIYSRLDVALSTRASESTLSAINSKITKCDTDSVTVVSLPNPPNLNIALSVIRDTIKRPWSNDQVHGTATPVSGSAGDNTITVRSGGDIDFDPGGKYLKSVVVELDSYAAGDYVKEVAYTNGTTRVTIAKNIPLAFSGKEITFTSPVQIPSGYWVEIVVTLSDAKNISAVTEFVW